ncbi:hypothetical protein M0R45_004084 [Rubus argutus]|uniref:Oxidoreductase-like domain-containing protein n=1 Tax=Rubus argutus TaxID=59490 RepID=A0AAW1YIS0_RUBAR
MDTAAHRHSEIPPLRRQRRKKKRRNPSRKVPPPPEKPEPGDCCGSGCVRCVWDVYYDELDEYNKLYKVIPTLSNRKLIALALNLML